MENQTSFQCQLPVDTAAPEKLIRRLKKALAQFSVIELQALGRWISALLLSAVLCFGAAVPQSGNKSKPSTTKSAAPTKSSKSGKAHARSKKRKRSKKASWRRGQQKIDPARARQIQEALIREHYLTGEASGVWDQRSQNAMVRFQTANGWQAKVVPDSRALIKLGLGPTHDHLLNPESAMTSPLQPKNAAEHVTSSKSAEHTAPSTPAAPTSNGSVDPVSNPQK